MADPFKLPASSYEELVKIIKAYASAGKEGKALSIETIVQTSGSNNTAISKNNGFLLEVGLITKGKAKAPTEMCKSLGRAYEYNNTEDSINIWKEIITNNDFLNRMISAIRIRNGMDRGSLINHIVYSSGMNGNPAIRAGAGAIIEILKYAGFVEEVDGKIIAKSLESLSPELTQSNKTSELDCNPTTTHNREELKVPICVNRENYKVILNINLDTNSDDLEGLADKVKKFIQNMNE